MNVVNRLVYVIFSFAISVFILLFSLGTITKNEIIKTNWIEDTATITEINERDKIIKISYWINDKKYVINMTEYSDKYNVDDTITIYLNPSNFEEYEKIDDNAAVYFFLIVGIIILTVGIYNLVLYIKIKKTKKIV